MLKREEDHEMRRLWAQRFASDVAVWFEITNPQAHYFRRNAIVLKGFMLLQKAAGRIQTSSRAVFE